MKKKFMSLFICFAMVILTMLPGTTADAAGVAWPVSGSYLVSQEYGGSHDGIDITYSGASLSHIDTMATRSIVAYKDGIVVRVYNNCSHRNSLSCSDNSGTGFGGYGNCVLLKHSDGTFSLYAHMIKGSITVAVNQSVTAGQKLGMMGNSGAVKGATGIHLHFEIARGDFPNTNYSLLPTYNPRDYLTGTPTQPGRPNVTYRVRTTRGAWLPEVTNNSSFAGLSGVSITDVAMKVSSGSIQYRVHVLGGGWLPRVSGYNTGDSNNGYAGNGRAIDAVEAIYTSASGTSYRIYYQVSPLGGNFYPYQINNLTGSGMDGYAGSFGKAIDRLQMWIQ